MSAPVPVLTARAPRRASGARTLALLASLCAFAPRALSAAMTPELAAKLDPALAAAAVSADEVTVWVELRDRGPGDLGGKLAAASAALGERCRARRLRAGVVPLVDERDVPVAPEYLAALAASGFRPFAVSRWFNRAAVRVPGVRLAELAAAPFVARLAAVPRALRSADPGPARPLPAPDAAPLREEGARGAAPSRGAVDAGLLAPALAQIGVPALHDSGYAGAGILVAVLDEGFNYHERHEALRDHVIAPGFSRDFVQGDTTVTDTLSGSYTHGTWVLGCLAGNRPGVYVGPAYAADLALARTENAASETPSEPLNWALAAEWADSLGADIISSSLGYTTFDAPFPGYVYADMDGHTTDITRAAEIAASKGILVVNSVGNEGNKAWRYLSAPADANGDSVLAVGAVDASGVAANFSSFGPSADGRVKPDLAARGVDVPLADATSDPRGYTTNSGTSFAAPLVAGLAACLMQARPAFTPRQVIRALRATASRVNRPDDRVGYGIPDGGVALCWSPGGNGLPEGLPAAGSARLSGVNPLRPGSGAVRVRFAAGGVDGGENRARVSVIDAAGRKVRSLWSGSLTRGECLDVTWGGESDEGGRVRPGIYFIALDAGGDTVVARVVALQ